MSEPAAAIDVLQMRHRTLQARGATRDLDHDLGRPSGRVGDKLQLLGDQRAPGPRRA